MSKNFGASPQLAQHLSQQKRDLQEQINRMQIQMLKRENSYNQKTNNLAGSNPPASQAGVLPFWMAPGNVGDINRVIWPFWFTTQMVQIGPNSQVPSGFSVTQEASFVALSYTKSVFVRTTVPAINYQYLDPEAPAGAGQATGLSFTLTDNTSTRQFIDKSLDTDQVGAPRFPTALPAPLLILPRSNISVNYINSNTVNTFVCFFTFFGYRIRIEDAYEIRSLASGQTNQDGQITSG